MTALAVIEETPRAVQTSAPRVGLLAPLAAPAQVLEAQNATRELIEKALQKDRDFGTVPGTDKPTLLKPGAERLNLAFGLAPRFRVVEREIDHDRHVEWVKRRKVYEGPKGARRYVRDEETTGVSLGLYRYVVECEIVHRDTGTVIASCIGVCSTMESKYIDRPRDVENTVAKMAEKRALVGATLLALGLSDQFTQDVEDLAANGAIDTEREGTAANDEPEAKCPKCGGRMWDNRLTKRSPKAPDFKCRDKNCDGVLWPGEWPPKKDEAKAEASEAAAEASRDFTICPAGPHAGDAWSDATAFDLRDLVTMQDYFARKAADADDPESPAGYAAAVQAEIARRRDVGRAMLASKGDALDASEAAPVATDGPTARGELPLHDARPSKRRDAVREGR